MKPNSAIKKGKRFEDWICDRIEAWGLGKSRREIGSGSGKRKGDIAWSGERTIEAKNEPASFPAWLLKRVEQAERQDIGRYGWTLVLRDPRAPEANFRAFAVMDFEDYLSLEKKAREPKLKEPDRELKWKLQALINGAKAVLKILEN